MITIEPISKKDTKNMSTNIIYGIHFAPFGWYMIGIIDKKICQFAMIKPNDKKDAKRKLRGLWPDAQLTRNDASTKPYLKKALANTSQNIHLLMKGTPFQIAVWRQLLKIQRGKTATYGEIAKAIHRPNAVRAVGSACGKNPIPILVPCHRVVDAHSGLGGYSGGLDRKKALLAAEK